MERKHKVKDKKVIPGEVVVSQHKLVVMELRIVKKRKSKLKRIGEIRSWKLKDGVVASELRRGAFTMKARGVADQGVNGMWNSMKDIIVRVAVKVCGRGRTGEPKGREEWWWNDEAQEVVKEKNITFKEANNERGDVEAENRYNEAKKKAKNRARDETSTDWYKELETKEGQQKFLG